MPYFCLSERTTKRASYANPAGLVLNAQTVLEAEGFTHVVVWPPETVALP